MVNIYQKKKNTGVQVASKGSLGVLMYQCYISKEIYFFHVYAKCPVCDVLVYKLPNLFAWWKCIENYVYQYFCSKIQECLERLLSGEFFVSSKFQKARMLELNFGVLRANLQNWLFVFA